MKHKQKKTLARRMRTRAETKAKVSIFQSKQWNDRCKNKKLKLK